jgi:hypothetical protein
MGFVNGVCKWGFPHLCKCDAGDDYVPQAWNKYMEEVQKWSDDMVRKPWLA